VYRAAGRGRSASPLAQALRRFPNPRLTGLGGGLFCVGTMLVLGMLDSLLFGSSTGFYGVMFLLVSGLTAGWVRRADLVAGPIAAPLAFAVGAVAIAQGGDGFGAQTMAVVTTLALNAGWLYAGTIIAGVVVLVRRARMNARRAEQQRRTPPGGGNGGAARRNPAAAQNPAVAGQHTPAGQNPADKTPGRQQTPGQQTPGQQAPGQQAPGPRRRTA
jgi:hypothetical protein